MTMVLTILSFFDRDVEDDFTAMITDPDVFKTCLCLKRLKLIRLNFPCMSMLMHNPPYMLPDTNSIPSLSSQLHIETLEVSILFL